MRTVPTLIMIDVQQAFDDSRWGVRNQPRCEENVAALIGAWRTYRAPIVHVPEGLFRGDGIEFKPEAMPAAGEPIVEKMVNSAFIGTNLETVLWAQGADAIVIAGLTTDHCCSTTARMAANLGFHTTVVSDATATFGRETPDGRWFDAETMHLTALASLAGEFAEVVDTAAAVSQLAGSPELARAKSGSSKPTGEGR
jgi:nicotinamidase-related amidase